MVNAHRIIKTNITCGILVNNLKTNKVELLESTT
jgi:hypothetical protein